MGEPEITERVLLERFLHIQNLIHRDAGTPQARKHWAVLRALMEQTRTFLDKP